MADIYHMNCLMEIEEYNFPQANTFIPATEPIFRVVTLQRWQYVSQRLCLHPFLINSFSIAA